MEDACNARSYTDKVQAPSFTSPCRLHMFTTSHQPFSKQLQKLHLTTFPKTPKHQQNHGRPPLPTPRPSRHNRILSPRARTTSTHTGTPPPPPPLQRAHRHSARGCFHHGLHSLRVQHDEHPGGERERPSVQRERYRWGRAEFDRRE